MLDEQQEAPVAEAEPPDTVDEGADDAVDVSDAGGDDAVDLAEMGAEVQTADEPVVSAEELVDIPDAPERWDDSGDIIEPGAAAISEERADSAAELGAQAAADDADAGRSGPVGEAVPAPPAPEGNTGDE